jgi:hypothetical protein
MNPRYIGAAGVVAIVAGVGSAVSMASSLLNSAFQFDLGVFGLPIGFGILAGRPSSRRWALFFSGAGALLYSWMAAWLMWKHLAGGLGIGGIEFLGVMVEVLPLLAASIFVFSVLIGSCTKLWFEQSSDRKDVPVISGGIVAIAAVYLCLITALSDWGHRSALEAVFAFRSSIVAFDHDTGARIPTVGVKSSALVGGTKSALPKVMTSFGVEDGAAYIEFSGTAIRPYEAIIASSGYEDAIVVIDAESPAVIKVRMQKVTKAAQPGATDNPDDAQRLREDH